MARGDASGSGSCLLKLLLGCGAIVLLLVLAAVGGCFWLRDPGEQIETTTIVSRDSIGALQLEDPAADEGTAALLEAFMRELQAGDDQRLPVWFPRRQRGAGDMGPVLPTSITVTLEDIAGADRPAVLAAINFRGWVRFFKLLFERFEADADDPDYRGHRLISTDGDFFIVFHDGTVLVSDRSEALRLAVDRILDGGTPTTGTAAALPLPAGTLPVGDWDALGGLRNDGGRLDALLAHQGDTADDGSKGAEPRLDLGPGAALGFGIDVESADRARATLRLVGTPAAGSAAGAELLRQLASAIESRVGASRVGRHVEISARTRVEDEGAVLDLDILGLQEALLEALDRYTDLDDARNRRNHAAPPAEDPAGGTGPEGP